MAHPSPVKRFLFPPARAPWLLWTQRALHRRPPWTSHPRIPLRRDISSSSSPIPSCILSSSSCVSVFFSSRLTRLASSAVTVSASTFRRSWSLFSCSSSNWDLFFRKQDRISGLWTDGKKNVQMRQAGDLRLEAQSRLGFFLRKFELARFVLPDVRHAYLAAEISIDSVFGRVYHG
jgi:hypothetical protein